MNAFVVIKQWKPETSWQFNISSTGFAVTYADEGHLLATGPHLPEDVTYWKWVWGVMWPQYIIYIYIYKW